MNFDSITDVRTALCPSALTSRDLYALWERREPVPELIKCKNVAPNSTQQIPWLQDSPALAADFTARAREQEEFLLVCDCAREALRFWGVQADSPAERLQLAQLRMHYAAALARLGYGTEARKQLEPLLEATAQPPLGPDMQADILLQLGNILREESIVAPMRAARDQVAEQALGFYLQALQVAPNRVDALALAAAAGFVISQPGSATRLQALERARQALERTEKIADDNDRSYHLTYCRGVAQAVLGEAQPAWETFHQLAQRPGATTAYLADARYWARTLAETLEQPADFFRSAFPPLPLVVFSGHLPDRSDRPERRVRFPLAAVDRVQAAIAEALAKANASAGMVSAAAGADLLFAKALRERGGKLHLILPWAEAEFRRTSVAPFEPVGQAALWQPMFEEALAAATTLRVVGEAYRPTSEVGLVYMMEVMAGLALHTARAMRLDVQPMALWDELPGHGMGGTESFVEFWRRLGHEPIILRPPPLELTSPTQEESITAPPAKTPTAEAGAEAALRLTRSERSALRQEVKSLLFADIVGYSKLNEAAIPSFIGVFLEAVSRLAAASAHAPCHVNTWGDALYAVFDFAQDAGCFATELMQLIREHQQDWLREGLCWSKTLEDGGVISQPLDIRVGLHAGPVFMHYNPVVRQIGFTGVHVSRAARIEPITPPGEVFASEEFAALVELDRAWRARRQQPVSAAPGTQKATALDFVCEYAGSMALAKGYPGRYRLYRVAPHRVFALEELAKAIHEDYCVEETKKGNTLAQNSSMRPWADLPETLRDSNRAQAADIPRKLAALGYELAPSFGLDLSAIELTREKAEELSRQEHKRWMQEKLRSGWRPGPTNDEVTMTHDLLVPWEELSEEDKAKDTNAVCNVPRLVEKAGFRVRRIVREKK